jgi:hypothetical protein
MIYWDHLYPFLSGHLTSPSVEASSDIYEFDPIHSSQAAARDKSASHEVFAGQIDIPWAFDG